jgi:phosphoglycerol transferase MdoB-like AlkP superfamily enzyme
LFSVVFVYLNSKKLIGITRYYRTEISEFASFISVLLFSSYSTRFIRNFDSINSSVGLLLSLFGTHIYLTSYGNHYALLFVIVSAVIFLSATFICSFSNVFAMICLFHHIYYGPPKTSTTFFARLSLALNFGVYLITLLNKNDMRLMVDYFHVLCGDAMANIMINRFDFIFTRKK